MKIGWIAPFLGEVGGVRSIVETGNCVKYLGHDFYIITSQKSHPPSWIDCHSNVITIDEAKKINFDALVNQDPSCNGWEDGIPSKVKILHHCSAYLNCVDHMPEKYDFITTCFKRGYNHFYRNFNKEIFFIGQGVKSSQFDFKEDRNISGNIFYCCRAFNLGNDQKGAVTTHRLLLPLKNKYSITCWDNTHDSKPKEFNFIQVNSVINKNSYARDIYHKADVVITLDKVSAWNCIAGEAMSSGTPVISNGEGLEDYGIPDYNYVLLEDFSSKSLDKCIQKLLKDLDFRKEIIFNAKKTMEGFTWLKVAERLIGAIERKIL